MSEPKTMVYNAGYEVHYEGYHYDTGCIDFPEEKWNSWFETKMKNSNYFYAYILDKDLMKFVGDVNFIKNVETKKATMSIVIRSDYQGKGYMRPAMKQLLIEARDRGVSFLTDSVPETREIALRVFYSIGFEKKGEFFIKKFGEEEKVAEIEIDVNFYFLAK